MSSVIALPKRSVPPERGPESQGTLRKLAARIAPLLLVLLVFTTGFTATVLVLGFAFGGAFIWLAPGAAYLGFPPEEVSGLVPFGSLPLLTRLAYTATFLLTQTPVLCVLLDLRALLRGFARGATFTPNHVRRLRQIALWLVLYALAPAFGHGLVSLAGQGVDLAWFHASSIHALLLAALFAVFAELVQVGRMIEQDRDGFI